MRMCECVCVWARMRIFERGQDEEEEEGEEGRGEILNTA